LEEQTLPVHEVVVVVDNNERLLKRIRSELGAVAIANSYAPGLGGARNSGLAATSGAVVAYLDDDAAAVPGWLASITAPYADPLVAGVGGSAEPAWETERPGWFPAEFDWVIGCSYRGLPHTAEEVRNLFGCNMSFRRSLLEELGGFRLGYGCDETEFCIRLRQRWPEKKLLYVPAAKVKHYVPASRTRPRRFLARCYFEGGSKAVVSRLVGREQGLASELYYTRYVLPAGARRGLTDFGRHGDPAGLGRAAAIVGGLTSTGLGYLTGRLMIRRAASRRGWQGSFVSSTHRSEPAGA
jgi:glycosyltransferase involved in cell wall biosynthesis